MATIQIDAYARTINNGYALRYIPGRRWVAEHRLVMENTPKRKQNWKNLKFYGNNTNAN